MSERPYVTDEPYDPDRDELDAYVEQARATEPEFRAAYDAEAARVWVLTLRQLVAVDHAIRDALKEMYDDEDRDNYHAATERLLRAVDEAMTA